MKKNLWCSFPLLLLVVLVSACQDPCTQTTCENGGTCLEGNCQCEVGYEGNNCELEIRAPLLGHYQLQQSCNSSEVAPYSCAIAPHWRGPLFIEFTNLDNLRNRGAAQEDRVYAELNPETMTFTIPFQQVYGHEFEGGGSWDDTGLITLEYDVFFNFVFSCEGQMVP
ncbi:MAG: calcium-binding EGF-like domain-containing protein [Bacteroidota bacterium]